MSSLIGRRIILAVVTPLHHLVDRLHGSRSLTGRFSDCLSWTIGDSRKLEALREEYGLNAPVHQRYLDWLGGVVKGDLGVSMVKRKPVAELIATVSQHGRVSNGCCFSWHSLSDRFRCNSRSYAG